MRSLCALFFVVCLCVSFAGCSGEADTSGPTVNPPANADTSTGSDAKPAETAEAGETSEEASE